MENIQETIRLILTATENGKLLDYIKANINVVEHHNLLYWSCCQADGKNVDFIVWLFSQDYEFNGKECYGGSCLHYATIRNDPKNTEVLCAVGVNVKKLDKQGMSPLDIAMLRNHVHCIKVLVANGVRLNSVRIEYTVTASHYMTTELKDFEQGVLRCRDVIVALLGLKKHRQLFPKLDRFLIRQEVAVSIWSTRSNMNWQK